MRNSETSLSQQKLQQQLEVTKQTSRDEVRRTRSVTRVLISIFRKRAAKLDSAQEESKRRLAALEDKQFTRVELDAICAGYISQVQALERDRQDALEAKSSAIREANDFKATIAQLEKSLAEANTANSSLRKYAFTFREQKLALERELSNVRESSKVEQHRLSQEIAQLQRDLTSCSEKATHETSSHESKVKDAVERTNTLLRQLERERRESGSIFTALRRQAEGASLASQQQDNQLSSLRAQHLQTEIALAEATQKIERYAQEVGDLRSALSRTEIACRTVETERDNALALIERGTSAAETCSVLQELVVSLAFLRRSQLSDVRAHAEQQMAELRRQLSTVQEQGQLERKDLEKRISELVAVLYHHEFGSFDLELDVLKPSPKLVSLWEAIHELIPVSQRQTACFPKFLTEDTAAVIPAISTLVDQLRSHFKDVNNLQLALAERDQQINLLQDELEVKRMIEFSSTVVSTIVSDEGNITEAETPSLETTSSNLHLPVVDPEHLSFLETISSKSVDVLQISKPNSDGDTTNTTAPKRKRRPPKKDSKSARKVPWTESPSSPPNSDEVHSAKTTLVMKRPREAQNDWTGERNPHKRSRKDKDAVALTSTSTSAGSSTGTPTVAPGRKFAYVEIISSRKPSSSRTQFRTRGVCPTSSATESSTENVTAMTTMSKGPHRVSTMRPAGIIHRFPPEV
ncbi:hypothetical protein C8J55DRAFT_495184 [Lentinula edodes]|uniref:Uncharacterized protein n=1 Tax=Lentinula lateritia TaxID=40482 RepID=A0A9W9B361_9AGAR|nr:hypothetical protein C8J55DRAFT_495184 [Lentinula edodes]